MTDLLSIGASGLRSYRAALGAVGDNVANANTEGYARRTVRIGEIAVTGTNPLYRNRVRFDGSEAVSVGRASDAFRSASARSALADSGRASALANALANGEDALGQDIAPALANVFASGDRLAADPAAVAPRLAFLASLNDATHAIRTSGNELARVAGGIGDAATTMVERANASLTALAAVNRSIARQPPGSAGFATLEDQRDVLIDGLAASIGATAILAADGTASVRAGAGVLLDGMATSQLAAVMAGDGRIAITVDAAPVALSGGTVAGLVAAAATTADRRGELDLLAAGFANAVNGWQASGLRPDGAPGAALIAGATATMLEMASDLPADVAAASPGAANGNALSLQALRASAGLEAAAAALVTRHAVGTAAAKAEDGRASVRRDTAAALRDAVEGIDLDTEAADLLRYQQAYQGSAKIIQAARDTLDAILALFR